MFVRICICMLMFMCISFLEWLAQQEIPVTYTYTYTHVYDYNHVHKHTQVSNIKSF